MRFIFTISALLLYASAYAQTNATAVSNTQPAAYYNSTTEAGYGGHIQVTTKPHKKSKFAVALIGGAWVPQGNAKVLGVHPQFGMLIGKRSKHNEFDITFNARVMRTPGEYTVLRGGNLYKRHTFNGGYIGLGYTRYFVTSTHFEAGFSAGVGYDAISIMNEENKTPNNDFLKPFDIISLNVNTGLRANILYGAHQYIGFEVKYNYINYRNHGGTAFDGNAITGTLLFGGFF